jgi:hypothetical protein
MTLRPVQPLIFALLFISIAAESTCAAELDNGRIGGMGDMPLQTLRDMIEMQK